MIQKGMLINMWKTLLMLLFQVNLLIAVNYM